ncbi:hypothetical protein I4U23_020680 [Adineta vaga]|nr:hypothetical protein I4U23_020680 [Adineta vaga]
MTSKSTVDIQRNAYEQLYSKHQTTRREHQVDLVKSIQYLNEEVQTALREDKNTYEKAMEDYHQEFNIFKRIFTSAASEHQKQAVLPVKEIYHERKDLANKIVELLNETIAETNLIETRKYWNGSIAVVYNPLTGRAEWKQNWHGGIHGVFNPSTGIIEWQQEFHHGVYGVFNPKLNVVEWKNHFNGGIHGVYNPSTGIIEWKSSFHSGVGGVYNPLTGQVEWKTSLHGGVVGYFNSQTQQVEWLESTWHHGIALIHWDSNSKTYLTTASCGWFDNE